MASSILRALSPRTKAVILCTPSNPTGSAYTEGETAALLEVVRKHDCWLIVDEIYAELVYDGLVFASAAKIAPDLRERLVVVDGVSKTYAMTGWRIGWALAPAPLIRALDVVQGQSTTNATAVAQHAAVAALKTPLEEFAGIRAMFQKRRDAMVKGLNSVPGIKCRTPEGFDGLHRMTAFVFGVSARASASGDMRHPSSSRVSTMTGVAPTMRTCSG